MGKVTYSTLSTMKSALTNERRYCINCGRTATDCHHIFEASDRRWSEKFGLMIPLCKQCHAAIHADYNLNLYYKQMAQKVFEEQHPDAMFTTFFRKNYL